jgi:anti-anti-sigma factor
VLRITQSSDRHTTTLRVEGAIDQRNLGELARACLPWLQAPQSLRLDLSAVRFVDSAGLTVLRDLARREVPLLGCSPLVAHLLKETQP